MSSEPLSGERRWDRDLLVAVLSGFIGAFALAVSTYNVYLQHQQVRAQVWPRLLFMPSMNETGFTFSLENGGIGPAKILSVRVLVDDKPVEDRHEAIVRMTGRDLKIHEWGYSPMHGTLVTAGQTRNVLIVKDKSVGTVLFEQQGRVRAEICYCSALHDRWVLKNNVPQPVSKCSPYADAFGD